MMKKEDITLERIALFIVIAILSYLLNIALYMIIGVAILLIILVLTRYHDKFILIYSVKRPL